MFTLDQIKAAHASVKSGADFPRYISELKRLGLSRYTYRVADGATEYQGADGSVLVSPALYEPKPIPGRVKAQEFADRLRLHQQGGTTYPQFCDDCARTGVERWVVDAAALTCTYYSAEGAEILVEAIPQ